MALACEQEVVADIPIASFMKRIFGASDEEVGLFVVDPSMATVITKSVGVSYNYVSPSPVLLPGTSSSSSSGGSWSGSTVANGGETQ